MVSLFTLPKLYEMKKEEIDTQVGRAKQQYNNVYEKHIGAGRHVHHRCCHTLL